jgi:hypothetical protein
MPDYQVLPTRQAQFGDPLDFSDPTGTLADAMRADTLEKGGQSPINSIHPDVHAALIQRERQGGGEPATLGPSWGSSMMEFLFGKPLDPLTASLQDRGSVEGDILDYLAK